MGVERTKLGKGELWGRNAESKKKEKHGQRLSKKKRKSRVKKKSVRGALGGDSTKTRSNSFGEGDDRGGEVSKRRETGKGDKNKNEKSGREGKI